MKRRIILPPSLTSIKPVTARCVLCFILPVCRSADCRTPVERRVVATLSLQSMTELYPTFAVALIWSPKGNSPSFGIRPCARRRKAVARQSFRPGHYETFGTVDSLFDAMREPSDRAHMRARLAALSREFCRGSARPRRGCAAGHSRFLATRTGSPHRTSPESICMNCGTSSFGWCDVPATIERSTRNLLGVALDRI